MSNPYIGEIRLTGFTFAPQGWAFCDGSLLNISDNSTLFALVGTTYGGDGQSTFGLPDLRSRIPIHFGNGFSLGQSGGAESVTLNVNQIPIHNHSATQCNSGAGSTGTPPAGGTWAASSKGNVYGTYTPAVNMGSGTIGSAGGGQSHENRQPLLALNYIIALEGVYPVQN